MVEQLNDVARNWTQLGGSDPMWAALTDRGKERTWDPAAFLKTGTTEIGAVLDLLARRQLQVDTGRALDFGCGPGRLTSALAAAGFAHVIGVDVSATMLAKAREIVPAAMADRCEFVLNEGSDLAVIPSRSIDLVYSCRVLQHMPPSLSAGYIREFMRVAAPGGVVVFQIPFELAHTFTGTVMRGVPRPLLNRVRRGMEMHGTSPVEITQIIRSAGGTTVSIEHDQSAGSRWRSLLYVARVDAAGQANHAEPRSSTP